MNIIVNYHIFELCKATLEIIKKILSCLYTFRGPATDRIFSKLLKDGAEVSGWPLYNRHSDSLYARHSDASPHSNNCKNAFGLKNAKTHLDSGTLLAPYSFLHVVL